MQHINNLPTYLYQSLQSRHARKVLAVDLIKELKKKNETKNENIIEGSPKPKVSKFTFKIMLKNLVLMLKSDLLRKLMKDNEQNNESMKQGRDKVICDP